MIEERVFTDNFTITWWGVKEDFKGYYLIPDNAREVVRYIRER
jgi:hypothetical protein